MLRPLDNDERCYLDYIRTHYRVNAPEENVFYMADCGGASGAYTEYTRALFWDFISRITVFEPVPEAYEALVEKYQDLGDIAVSPVVVAATTGRVEFDVRENSEHSQVLVCDPEGRLVMLDTDTIDNLFQWQQHLHLLKIDVEGEELNVIRGAKRLISQGRIDFIQFEYGGTWIARHETFKKAAELLPGWKYFAYNVEAQKMELVDFMTLEDDFAMRNFLCSAPHVVS